MVVDQKNIDEVDDDVVEFDSIYSDQDLSKAKGSFKYDGKSKKLIKIENRICM
jgi:hypothetical protein